MAQFRRAVRFCQEDIIGTLDVLDRFAQKPARQNMMVVERGSRVHEQNVDVRLETQILEAVIKDQGIGAELVDGVQSRFDAVLVNQNDNVFQVGGEHERFVARRNGVQQEIFAVGYHARRDFHFFRGELFAQFRPERPFVTAPVSAAQDGDLAPLFAEGFRENFNDRRFSRSAAGEIADADHQTADRTVADHAVVVHPDTELDQPPVDAGTHEQCAFGKVAEAVVTAFADDLDKRLFYLFSDFTDGHILISPVDSEI